MWEENNRKTLPKNRLLSFGSFTHQYCNHEMLTKNDLIGYDTATAQHYKLFSKTCKERNNNSNINKYIKRNNMYITHW